MVENLISEAIGVVVELVLVYFMIDHILKSRENKRLKPVRENVYKALVDVSSSIYDCALNSVVAPSDNTQVRGVAAQHLLKLIPHKLQNLNKLIDLSGHALDSNSLPHILKISESLELVFEKTQFFSQINLANMQNFDFVSIMPVEELKIISSELDKLKDNIQISDESKVLSLDRINEFRLSWEKASQERPNLYFNIEEYRWTGEREPFAFSTSEFIKMSPGNANRVKVYKDA